MANAEPISALPAQVTALATDIYPMLDTTDSITKKTTLAQIQAYVIGGTANNVTTGTATLAPFNSYLANSGSLTTFALPTTGCPFGSVITIIGWGAGGWMISQSSGQNIREGNVASTTGVTGNVQSGNQYDCAILYCTVANTSWTLYGVQGNLIFN